MNKVASHINEMQKLHEEYGAVFDQLINEQTAVKKEVKALARWPVRGSVCLGRVLRFVICPCQVADLSMGDLLLHCTVAWINPPAPLVKSKKEPHLAAFGKDCYGFFFFFSYLRVFKKHKNSSFRDFKLLALQER